MPEPLFSRTLIARHARLSEEDRARLSQCRLRHTRLGFAYQLAFLRLMGQLPRQQPLEIARDLLRYVAHQLGFDDQAHDLIERYAGRQPTISAHAEQVCLYLGMRSFGPAEREALRMQIHDEAQHLEQTAGLVARAEEFLRKQNVLVPATSAIKRLVSEERTAAHASIFERIGDLLSGDMCETLDALLVVEEDNQHSPLQALKEPPGASSPRALLRETEKLDVIVATGILDIDFSWLRGSLKKAMARRVRYSSVHTIRRLMPPRRYAALLCFLQETHADTIDHVVDLHAKLVTQAYRRAQRRHDEELKAHRRSLMGKLSSFRTIGGLVLAESVTDAELRKTILEQVPMEKLREQVDETEEWLYGSKSDVFSHVTTRFSYFRQFSPSLFEHLSLETESASASNQVQSLVESVAVLRRMNKGGKRKIPEDAPMAFIPKARRRFVKRNGRIDRAAYECVVLTVLRDEIRRGNVAIRGSKRFGHLAGLFMPDEAWGEEREAFYARSGLPAEPRTAVRHLDDRLGHAYDRFLSMLPRNAYVTFEKNGSWRFGTDPAEKLSPEAQQQLNALSRHLGHRMRRIRLPDLLIEVDNELRFTRHFSLAAQGKRTPQDVCVAVATVIAYGCNLGPHTMARLTKGVSYSQIKRVADWHLHEDLLRAALADIVNAISRLDTARVWGKAKTSASDGQRFLFPRKTVKRTYSHRMGDYALEFYSFVADNYAPFYSAPIECTERDAAYVLDGLLYHEADLEIDEHYTDTHGYTEANFAAFALLGKRFCPRIRGLSKQRIYRIDQTRDYGPLQSMLSRRDRQIHLDWIEEEWDRIGQFFCSMATGHTTASVAMKRLVAFGSGNHFYRAVRDLGRVFKTEFVLDYLTRPALRRRVRQGLLKSEELHALARSVFYGKLGRADWRDFRRQMSTASCLLLILAAIVYWQIKEIEQVLADESGRAHANGADRFDLLEHVSPVSWDNVTLYGEYELRRELVDVRGL
ncbi:MAG: Tn3 family transposase [Gemmatimonadales bacterium]